MEHINTLDTFDNLVASGTPENQARAQVKMLNNAFDNVATKNDLKLTIDPINLKLNFILWIMGVFATCALGVLFKIIYDFIIKICVI